MRRVRLKSITRVVVICVLSLFGSGVILTIMNMNVGNEFSAGYGRIVHVGEGCISKGSATSSTLFDNRTESAVLNCITGEVIGTRPRHIDTIDIRQLPSISNSEPDLHRKASFSKIFHNREWGKNPNVNFSASGKNTINISLCHAGLVVALLGLHEALLQQLVSLLSYSLSLFMYNSRGTIVQNPEN